ncbi:RING/U-box superfamily protein [Zea mays]|uniref:RING/U-box superfamily protein n=1 Tax=Zea mays TaxID=4577 RepID=A0A1D6G1F0_MAIZE|nr:RING/U-box superfamily protein [Zea mays]
MAFSSARKNRQVYSNQPMKPRCSEFAYSIPRCQLNSRSRLIRHPTRYEVMEYLKVEERATGPAAHELEGTDRRVLCSIPRRHQPPKPPAARPFSRSWWARSTLRLPRPPPLPLSFALLSFQTPRRCRAHRRAPAHPTASPRILLQQFVALLLPLPSSTGVRRLGSMRTRHLYFTSLGMEVQVLDLSSDSEGEVSAHSPDHKRPSQQPGVDPNRRVGDNGSSAVDSLFEEAGAARPPRHPSDALNKGKEKVVDVESVESPKHGGESLGAAGRVLGAGSDPWSALVSKCKAGDSGNNGTECWDSWGDWGDQLTNSAPVARLGSERTGFHETYELRGTPQLHSDSSAFSDQWKGILGASPADPVNSLWCSRDTSMKDSEDETLSQRSVSVREISSCDYFLTEDSSSSWLSKVKGLNFPLPDEHQLRTRQIENDEMFARRLQEQLNQQQPGSQHSEAVVTLDYSSLNVDKTIAWTLHEQDAEHARFAAREVQSSSSQRDRSMAHLYSYGRHSPVQSFASWASNHTPISMSSRGGLQRNSNCPQAEQRNMLISQLTRGCFREDMDLQTRLAVLDSLSEAFRNCEDTHSPDSDDDDYEDQIALGVDSQQRGASDDQINSLPLSVIECIDRWLGMKIWCPVCKSNVFSQ